MTFREAIAEARKELRRSGRRDSGGVVHYFGDVEPEDRDDDMRPCTAPDGRQSVVWHAQTREITGGEWCRDCGETDVEEAHG